MNPINDEVDNARNENNAPPCPPDRAVAPPRQPRRKISFWLTELNHDHLSEGALVRATRVMEAALCQDQKMTPSNGSVTAVGTPTTQVRTIKVHDASM